MNNCNQLGVRIGCAGWSISTAHGFSFPTAETHLSRYAREFSAVEINSSFYKSHKTETYAKWASSVPEGFRFAVKVPKAVTHIGRLVDSETLLDDFLTAVSALGEKLGPLLVQLPPSLNFTATVAERFLLSLRQRYSGDVVLEPRHASWFEADAEELVTAFRIARVAADPALFLRAAEPGGWSGLAYFRLHGSPRIYYSEYSGRFLDALVEKISASTKSAVVWCIFDNTAAGAAVTNALEVRNRLRVNHAIG